MVELQVGVPLLVLRPADPQRPEHGRHVLVALEQGGRAGVGAGGGEVGGDDGDGDVVEAEGKPRKALSHVYVVVGGGGFESGWTDREGNSKQPPFLPFFLPSPLTLHPPRIARSTTGRWLLPKRRKAPDSTSEARAKTSTAIFPYSASPTSAEPAST